MAPGRLSITQVSPQIGRQLALQQSRNSSPPPTKTNNNSFECYMCEKFTSNSVEGIGAHVKKEHLNLKEGLGCVFEGCTYRGSIMAEMRNHYSSVHESKESREAERTTCLLCGARRRTEGEVMRHIRIVHLKDNEYLCNACGRFATFSLKEWANHVHQNHENNPPKIEFRRSEGFDPSKRLPMTAQPAPEEVVDLTDGPEEGKKVSYTYSCSFCKYTTKEISDMSVHVKKHGQNTKFVIKYQNDVTKAEGTTSMTTNTTSTTTTTMAGRSNQKQLALLGPEEKPGVQFKCFHCPEKFSSKDILLKHFEKEHDMKGSMETNAGSKDKTQLYEFLCMLCDKRTQSDEDIKKHVISTHFKTFQSICPHCPHVASSPADLQSHGQQEHYKHFSLSKLLCAKCDYTSKNIEVMQTHTSKAHGPDGKKKDSSDAKDAEGESKKDDTKSQKRKREESSEDINDKKEDAAVEMNSTTSDLEKNVTEPGTNSNNESDKVIVEEPVTKDVEKKLDEPEKPKEENANDNETKSKPEDANKNLDPKNDNEINNDTNNDTSSKSELDKKDEESPSNNEKEEKADATVLNKEKLDETVNAEKSDETMETDTQTTKETPKDSPKVDEEESNLEAKQSAVNDEAKIGEEKDVTVKLGANSEETTVVKDSENVDIPKESNEVESNKEESDVSKHTVKTDAEGKNNIDVASSSADNAKPEKIDDAEDKPLKIPTKEPEPKMLEKEENEKNSTTGNLQRSTRSSRSQPNVPSSPKEDSSKASEKNKEAEKSKELNVNDKNASPYPTRNTRSQGTPPTKPHEPTPSKKIRLSALVEGNKSSVSKSGNNFDAPLPLS